MNTLILQPYGLDGTDVVRAAPATDGSVIPGVSPPEVLVLSIENVGGATRTATLLGHGRCQYGQHALPIVVPAGTLLPPIAISLGIDGSRFGDGSVLAYDVSADFRVAAAVMRPLLGVGMDIYSAAPAGSPLGQLVVSRKDDDPVFTAAAAGGMRVRLSSERLQLVVANSAGAYRTCWLNSARRCRHGFLDAAPPLVVAPGVRITKDILASRFGAELVITYPDPDGLSIAAVRQEDYR